MNDFQWEKKLSSLFTLEHEGYQLDRAFYTAWSMDYSYWQTLLTLQCGGAKQECVKENAVLSAELTRTFFCVEKVSSALTTPKRLPEDLLNVLQQRTMRYNNTSGGIYCFHAKMAYLKYTKPDGPDYYRIGIFSKNLTSDDDYQNICVLDGFVNETLAPTLATANGEWLWAYLRHCRAHVTAPNANLLTAYRNHLDEFASIRRLVLPDNCQVFFSGLDPVDFEAQPVSSKSRLEQKTRLWDVLMGKPVPQWGDEEILYGVTKSTFVRGYWPWVNPARGGKIRIYNCYKSAPDQKNYSDKTHMKLYWRKVSKDPEKWEFWSGSANCSAAALGKTATGQLSSRGINVECLVRISELPDVTALVQSLGQTEPQHLPMQQQPLLIKRREEESDESMTVLEQLQQKYSFTYKALPDGTYELQVWDKTTNTAVPVPPAPKRGCWEWKDANGDHILDWTVTPYTEFRANDTLQQNCGKTTQNPGCAVLSLWNPVTVDEDCSLQRYCIVLPVACQLVHAESAAYRAANRFVTDLFHKLWMSQLLMASSAEERLQLVTQLERHLDTLDAMKTQKFLNLSETQEKKADYLRLITEHWRRLVVIEAAQQGKS